MNKICYGCGAKLQSESSELKGYVPSSKIDNATYCMRCFRMMHYGENKEMDTPKDDYEIINKINKDDKFVIFLVDFLNINEGVMNLFKAIKKSKVLVVNKCELMPISVKKEKFVDFLYDEYDIKDEIILKGGTTHHGARVILKYLETRNIREAYILGVSNSGKSTLINDIMDLYKSSTAKIVVNSKANTTLDFIRVKLSPYLTLIDSPGFILDNALNHDASGKKVTSYVLQMKENETASLLDDKIYLNFSDKTSMIFYTNGNAKKCAKKVFKDVGPLKTKIIVDKPPADIVIHGIGFVTIKNPCIIKTNIDSKYIEVRFSMFGGKHE